MPQRCSDYCVMLRSALATATPTAGLRCRAIWSTRSKQYTGRGRPLAAVLRVASSGRVAWSIFAPIRRARSRDNVHHHYDLRTDFYQRWLDPQLVYTCAYFPTPSATLEEAQIAKMDHVCRKLQLQPGETVVEAGCGWGALALHMARHYGVRVKAFNLSHEQIVYARQRARQEGLAGRSSSSKTITATSPAASTLLSRSGCWNTWD